jgi:hypothetical protein
MLWKLFPGFDRLQRAIDLMENRKKGPPPAFEPARMVQWLRQTCPDGQPEPSLDRLLSPERFADDLERGLRHCVTMYGG